MSKSLLGIDIGSYSIKAAEIRKSQGKFFLQSLGEISLPYGLALSDSKEAVDTVSTYVKRLFLESGCHSVNTISAIPSGRAFTTVVEVPFMPEEELDVAMKWEVKKQIAESSEVSGVSGWQIVGKNGNNNEIMIVSTPKETVEKYLNIVRGANLKPASLEIEPLALARSLTDNSNRGIINIHFGSHETIVSILEKGSPKFIRNVRMGEDTLVDVFLEISGKDKYKAKNNLYEFGLLKSRETEKVLSGLKGIIDIIAQESDRLIKYYQDKYKKDISYVVLSGGCTEIPNLVDYISQYVSKEVHKANPWNNVDCSHVPNPEKIISLGPRFSAAVGLAMAE